MENMENKQIDLTLVRVWENSKTLVTYFWDPKANVIYKCYYDDMQIFEPCYYLTKIK